MIIIDNMRFMVYLLGINFDVCFGGYVLFLFDFEEVI